MKRIAFLTTLLILAGMIVLSAPVAAAGKVSVDKAKAVVVKSVVVKPTLVTAIKWQFRLWLGWPPIQVDGKKPVEDGPQKGYGPGQDPKWISAPIRDHGSSDRDI
jgi:hypothetical protein